MEKYTYKNKPKNKDIKYINDIPWFKRKEQEDNDRVMNAFHLIHKQMKSRNLILEKEYKLDDIKYSIEYDCLDFNDKQKLNNSPKKNKNLGKLRFDLFNKKIQKSLIEFCKDLGYKNKNKLFDILGEFENTFPIPIVPHNPYDIIKNNYLYDTN